MSFRVLHFFEAPLRSSYDSGSFLFVEGNHLVASLQDDSQSRLKFEFQIAGKSRELIPK